MLKTNKTIKNLVTVALFAIFTIPTLVFAGGDNNYGGYYLDGGSGWNGGSSYGSPVSYTDYSYQPVYADYYTQPSYSSNYGGGYSLPSYGSNFNSSFIPAQGLSYGSSLIPNSGFTSTSNSNKNTSSSNSTSSSSATAINNNVNNVYVYTNPTGNAVVNNPGRVRLDGYCVITPSNPRTGQTVTATAYATGGIGNYTYTWGGDINSASGATTVFTSYTTGIKYINVTIRSDQEIITKTCTVTFDNNTVFGNFFNSNTPSYTGSSVNLTPSITSGTPVSGVYLSELPATGLSLTFFDYMVASMVLVLASVFAFVYQAKKRLTIDNI